MISPTAEGVGVFSPEQRLAFLCCQPIPDTHPSRRTPFTRRMPAARSGLRRPQSEASYVAAHDLRRTCARLCHQAGGELDQIQFLLGHVSSQPTERSLGCKQRFHDAVNDHIGLEPDAPS